MSLVLGDDQRSTSPAESSAVLPSSSRPYLQYNDLRGDHSEAESRKALWDALDAYLNGPEYDRMKCPWRLLPILGQRRPKIHYEFNKMMSKLGRQRLTNEVVLDSYSHVSRVHALMGMTFYPQCVIQGEYAHLADWLNNLYPLMLGAARDADLPQMQGLIEAGIKLLKSMQELVDVETAARELISRTC